MISDPRRVDSPPCILDSPHLQQLIDVLIEHGYCVIGPTLRDQTVIYDEIQALDDLPVGWVDEQSGGTYRLRQTGTPVIFGCTVSPQSWKRWLHPPSETLWRAKRVDGRFEIMADEQSPPRYAFIGVRPCELAAIRIQDRVFLDGEFIETRYRARREAAFIIVVNCGRAGGTCFCASMNTGPEATDGFDLSLTEIIDGGRHYFVMQAGSPAGQDILSELPHQPAADQEIEAARRVISEAAMNMGRQLNTDGLRDLLYRNYEHPRWEAVAQRCLTCGNCTQVCPTCFCVTVEDVTTLNGDEAQRVRKWDSCFTMDFSYIHGGSIRYSAKSRYRQWMTHKLATWLDQFGTFGCVGCGRCITWCPVGIDITEEASIIRASDNQTLATKKANRDEDF